MRKGLAPSLKFLVTDRVPARQLGKATRQMRFHLDGIEGESFYSDQLDEPPPLSATNTALSEWKR